MLTLIIKSHKTGIINHLTDAGYATVDETDQAACLAAAKEVFILKNSTYKRAEDEDGNVIRVDGVNSQDIDELSTSLNAYLDSYSHAGLIKYLMLSAYESDLSNPELSALFSSI